MRNEASPTLLSSLKHLEHFPPPRVLRWCPCWMHHLFRDGAGVRRLLCFPLTSFFPFFVSPVPCSGWYCPLGTILGSADWSGLKKQNQTNKAKNPRAYTCPIFIGYFQSGSYLWCFFRIPGASFFPRKVVHKPVADETNKFGFWKPQF